MVVFGIILIAVVFGVVFKVLISEAKPYKKPLNTENAVEDKVISKSNKKATFKKEKSDSAIIDAVRTRNLYNMAKGGYGAAGVGRYDEVDDAQYREHREELAAYDDFVASLDMDD